MSLWTRQRDFRIWLAILASAFLIAPGRAGAREKWSKAEAVAWGEASPWLVGCNYITSSAVNQLEMWQADTFDSAAIERELGWAESLGFNSVRVFLHHLLWKDDREGLLKRMEQFLQIAEKHHVGVMFVLLDGVWDPFPKSGPQSPPTPHRHNPGWVQSPGVDLLKDPSRHDELEGYIKGVVGHFRGDRRVQVWDLFNEPDNPNRNSYGKHEPANKPELALALLKKLFRWARAADPVQPLTCGVWWGQYSPEQASEMNRFQVEESDVVSFHCYDKPDRLKEVIATLKEYGRPLLCTEYMARANESQFDPSLSIFKEAKIGAYNWGFVSGKSQTIYPWDSWTKTYDAEPEVWFHDIFRKDGSAYRQPEVDYIRKVTGR